MFKLTLRILPVFTLISVLATSGLHAADKKNVQPKVINPGPVGGPPSDAIILFDGTDLSKWRSGKKEAGWKVEDGIMEVNGTGGILTKEEFGDVQLHVEGAAPMKVKGKGQGRGNSGVYLQGRYEIQVLDSYENKTYPKGQAGAFYNNFPPLVNASRKPGEWQTYDIIFHAPKPKEDGSVEPGSFTVLHNGVLVQDNVELTGPTSWLVRSPYPAGVVEGSIGLQDHGNPLRYRNIWVRELKTADPLDSPFVKPELPKTVSVPPHVLDAYVGTYGNTRVTREGSRLFVARGGQDRIEVFAVLPRVFECALLDGRYEFLVGESGNIEKMKFTVADGSNTFTKKK